MSGSLTFLFGPFASFGFMRMALVACVALALASGPIGILILLRRMSLDGDVLSHAVMPGAALGFLYAGYSLAALTNKKLVGARDPLGIRPLVIGRLDGAAIIASETCALDIIGAERLRDVMPGELVSLGPDGVRTRMLVEGAREAFVLG